MSGNLDNQSMGVTQKERRFGQKDRRVLNTYVAEERRGGIADRRKPRVYRFKRLRLEDRRQTHTYVANDRRSGIADRRNPKRIIPPWWRLILK
jgi:hypothetical protein